MLFTVSSIIITKSSHFLNGVKRIEKGVKAGGDNGLATCYSAHSLWYVDSPSFRRRKLVQEDSVEGEDVTCTRIDDLEESFSQGEVGATRKVR